MSMAVRPTNPVRARRWLRARLRAVFPLHPSRGFRCGCNDVLATFSDIAAFGVADLRQHGLDVRQDECSASPFQKPGILEQVQFARHGLASCENAGGNLGVERRRRHDGAAPVGAIRPTKPNQLGDGAVLDIETVYFVDAPVQQTKAGGDQREHLVAGVGVPMQRITEDGGRHARHRRSSHRQHAGRSRLPVYGGKLAEKLARADIAKYHLTAAAPAPRSTLQNPFAERAKRT
jgi:hypothetical protein